MVCPSVPTCIQESSRAGLGPMGATRAPHLSISVTRSRFASVSVRCVLTVPERRVAILPGSSGHSSPWFGSSGVLSDTLKRCSRALIDTHNTWRTQLHRVGTMIRSTSLEALTSLGSSSSASGSKKAAEQLPGPEPPRQDDDDGDEQQRAEQQVAQLKASLSRFITTASRAEVVEAAMLSDLSNMAYDVTMISSDQLRTSHNLRLVACSRPLQPAAPAPLQAPPKQQQQQQQLLAPPRRLGSLSSQATVWDAAPHLPSRANNNSSSGSGFSASTPASPRTPFVLSSFSEGDDLADMPLAATASGAVSSPGTPRRLSSAQQAAVGGRPAAAAPAATDAAGFTPSRSSSSSGGGGSAGAVLASQLMHFQQQVADTGAGAMSDQQQLHELQQLQELLLQEQAIMQQLQEQVRLGGAVSSSSSSAGQPAPPAAAGSPLDGTPADWFVVDGPAAASATAAVAGAGPGGPVRYFVIQGSITLEHWRINLTIDPCEFEGGALGGVKVHRGVYEAALAMYGTFVPLVEQHLAAHPDGRIAFTGHSLGGSLATLLMLLLVHRGVLPLANVATVRTFGSPAIFCEGATGSAPSAGPCHSCALPCKHRAEREAAEAAAAAAGGSSSDSGRVGGLLARLGLSPEAVVNVIMTRDIVPRAFVCDYTLVANVLKRWLPSFKEHGGLAACKEHKALYNFIGQIEVLQPSLDCSFVLPDEGHFMLPDEAALYRLTEPTCDLPGGRLRQPPAKPAPAAAVAPEKESPLRQRRRGLGGTLASSFGSLTSLASLGSSSLSSALADLTSGFTLVAGSSGSSSGGSSGMVAVPVSPAEAAAEAAAAAGAGGASAVDAALAQGRLQLPADEPELQLPAAGPRTPTSAVASPAAGRAGGLTLGDAILTFMNSPHPLDTLGEMRAYGHSGQISRFHNPNSYTIGLSQLCGRACSDS